MRPSKDASRYADLIDGPYVEWNTDVPLPDPKTAVMEDLIFGMIDIVETEGPLRKDFLYQIFIKGVGRKRVTKTVVKTFDKERSHLLSNGRLEAMDQIDEKGQKHQVLYAPDTPQTVLRPRGRREFVDIPLAEVSALISRIRGRTPSLSGESLYRVVLDVYDTKRVPLTNVCKESKSSPRLNCVESATCESQQ